MAYVILDIINQYKTISSSDQISLYKLGITYGTETWLAIQWCSDDYVRYDASAHPNVGKGAKSLSSRMEQKKDSLYTSVSVLREVARSLISRK